MKQLKKKIYKDTDIIRASEIGQFFFCSISWYLHKCGYKPNSPNIEYGIKKHEDLGRIIELSKNRSKKSNAFAVAGYAILIIGILFIFFEVVL